MRRDEEVSAARRSLEMEKLRADMRKTQLEITSLEQKIGGREKPTRWMIAQHLAVIAGIIVSVGTYLNSVRDTRQRAYQSALGNYRDGSVAGAVELAGMGPDGLRELVHGVNPVPSLSEESWPKLTLATLDELKRLKLDKAHIALLVEVRDANVKALTRELTAIQMTRTTPTPNAQSRLRNLACVQYTLQDITGPPTDALWTKRTKPLLEGYVPSPDC